MRLALKIILSCLDLFSSRRGRPPKQGLSSLSSYEDFNEDDPVQMKKYRVDEKDSSSHGDLNGKLMFYLLSLSLSRMFSHQHFHSNGNLCNKRFFLQFHVEFKDF
jgi:hypothetical protein